MNPSYILFLKIYLCERVSEFLGDKNGNQRREFKKRKAGLAIIYIMHFA
jgi:hypothetical protein